MADPIAAIRLNNLFCGGCATRFGENGIRHLRDKGFIIPCFFRQPDFHHLMEQLFNEGYRTMKKKMKEEEEATKELKKISWWRPGLSSKAPPKQKPLLNLQLKTISMKLYTINTGYFKLDGSAMFGVVPKSIWNKLNPAEKNNVQLGPAPCWWKMGTGLFW